MVKKSNAKRRNKKGFGNMEEALKLLNKDKENKNKNKNNNKNKGGGGHYNTEQLRKVLDDISIEYDNQLKSIKPVGYVNDIIDRLLDRAEKKATQTWISKKVSDSYEANEIWQSELDKAKIVLGKEMDKIKKKMVSKKDLFISSQYEWLNNNKLVQNASSLFNVKLADLDQETEDLWDAKVRKRTEEMEIYWKNEGRRMRSSKRGSRRGSRRGRHDYYDTRYTPRTRIMGHIQKGLEIPEHQERSTIGEYLQVLSPIIIGGLMIFLYKNTGGSSEKKEE